MVIERDEHIYICTTKYAFCLQLQNLHSSTLIFSSQLRRSKFSHSQYEQVTRLKFIIISVTIVKTYKSFPEVKNQKHYILEDKMNIAKLKF